MSKSVEALKERAQELIADELRAAEIRKGGEDEGLYAERLLGKLEPIVFKYAPPPDSVIGILQDKGMLRPTLRV